MAPIVPILQAYDSDHLHGLRGFSRMVTSPVTAVETLKPISYTFLLLYPNPFIILKFFRSWKLMVYDWHFVLSAQRKIPDLQTVSTLSSLKRLFIIKCSLWRLIIVISIWHRIKVKYIICDIWPLFLPSFESLNMVNLSPLLLPLLSFLRTNACKGLSS